MFIIAAERDLHVAQELRKHLETLEQQGFIVIWDDRNPNHGSARFDIFLILCSDASKQDQGFQKQFYWAMNRMFQHQPTTQEPIRIVPVRLDPEAIPFLAMPFQWVPSGEPVYHRQDQMEALAEVAAFLRALVDPQARRDPPPIGPRRILPPRR